MRGPRSEDPLMWLHVRNDCSRGVLRPLAGLAGRVCECVAPAFDHSETSMLPTGPKLGTTPGGGQGCFDILTMTVSMPKDVLRCALSLAVPCLVKMFSV